MSSSKGPFFNRLEAYIQSLNRILGIISIIALVAMMLLTVLDVFLRSFFNWPINGSVELIELSMVCAGFLGLGWCALCGMHIKVDLMAAMMPKGFRTFSDVLNYVLGLGICLVFVWRGVAEGIAHQQMNFITPILKVPLFPFYWIMSIGFVFLCLAILILLVKSIAEVIK